MKTNKKSVLDIQRKEENREFRD